MFCFTQKVLEEVVAFYNHVMFILYNEQVISNILHFLSMGDKGSGCSLSQVNTVNTKKYRRNWRNKERKKEGKDRKSRACLAKSRDGRQVVDK